MASLQGPAVCPVIHAKQTGVCSVPISSFLLKAKVIRTGFWGLLGNGNGRTNVNYPQSLRKCKIYDVLLVHRRMDMAAWPGNSNENESDYVNSSVVEAVEVKSGPHGFMIKMRDGWHLRCAHNNPQGSHRPLYAPHPAIVLMMEDGTGILLLPIIMPSVLLMTAVRNFQIARPTMYQVAKEMIEKMGYTVKLVRITKRIHEQNELHLTKRVRFDLRPSDAINIAVTCKVPIQVNKCLVYTDGRRVIGTEKMSLHSSSSDGLFPELDSSVEGHALSTSLKEELDIGHDNVISLWYYRRITCI
ncbi:bifunctional nuclease 2-like [Olea europaea subsp. europaea]|uniref:Bifunctional nuclease 2-like n=1 Tax=Olea europaea subsp. europaea TaxID=158383 RepID=A0A8S0TLX8_OLEEU|nr:bifunctional nuclease 2-like [Olea europaea subsp. europaea]